MEIWNWDTDSGAVRGGGELCCTVTLCGPVSASGGVRATWKSMSWKVRNNSFQEKAFFFFFSRENEGAHAEKEVGVGAPVDPETDHQRK